MYYLSLLIIYLFIIIFRYNHYLFIIMITWMIRLIRMISIWAT